MLPSFSRRERLTALYRTLAGLFLFRRFEYGPWLLHMQHYFAQLRLAGSLKHLSAAHMQCLGRRELLREQLVFRLFAPSARCVARSLALCAYLRSLGLPAQFVLAACSIHVWQCRILCLGTGLWNEPDELPPGYAIFTANP